MPATLARVAFAADGRDGREPVGILDGQRPRAEPTHAQPGHIDAVRVDAIGGNDLVEQPAEGGDLSRAGPPGVFGALGRRDHEGEILPLLGNELRRPVHGHPVEVVTPLARPVQEQHQRPRLVAFGVLGRQVQQVIQMDGDADFLLKRMRMLSHNDLRTCANRRATRAEQTSQCGQ